MTPTLSGARRSGNFTVSWCSRRRTALRRSTRRPSPGVPHGFKGVDASGLCQDLNPGPRRAESSWTGWRAHPTELHRLVSGF